MNALLMAPVRITLPGQAPKLIKKESLPDLRVLTVVPMRAAADRRLTGMELRVLMLYGSYTNKAGLCWVGLERIGQHLGIGKQRVHTLTKGLEAKGYIKTVYKGFRGERADTRQVIFKDGISPGQAAQVAGELAPYQAEAQRKQQDRLIKRAKAKPASSIVSSQAQTDLVANDCHSGLVESNEQMTKLDHIDPAYVQLARDHVGTDATDDQLLAAIDELLR